METRIILIDYDFNKDDGHGYIMKKLIEECSQIYKYYDVDLKLIKFYQVLYEVSEIINSEPNYNYVICTGISWRNGTQLVTELIKNISEYAIFFSSTGDGEFVYPGNHPNVYGINRDSNSIAKMIGKLA